jgi:DNA-binding transcriptional MerR regulator
MNLGTKKNDEQVRAEAFVASVQHSGDGELFGIADLCQEFGISPRAVRFYEDKGLLSPRRVNGARIYTRRDRARLLLILRGKAIGSSLAEIKHYLELYGQHGEGRAQQLKYAMERTGEAIRELEDRRANIDVILAELRVINASVQRQLEQRQRSRTED